jgi:hypothetical protein
MVLTQQIPDLFVVYFDERASDQNLSRGPGVNNLKNMVENIWHDSSARDFFELPHHSVSLATACLSVGKNRSIVASECIFDN